MKIKKIKKIKDQAKITEPNEVTQLTEPNKTNEINETNETNETKSNDDNEESYIEIKNEEDPKSTIINDKIKPSEKEKGSYFKITLENYNMSDSILYLLDITYICNQVLLIVIIVLVFIHILNYKTYDFIIYFSFGIAISILIIATVVLISRFNIMTDQKYVKKYHTSLLNFYNKYTNLSNENIAILSTLINYLYHILGIILALLYVKNYIKTAKRTNNTFIFSYILFFIYIVGNLFFNDIYNIYIKPFGLSNNEYNLSLISITFTYSGLLYYFENIKNENYKIIKL